MGEAFQYMAAQQGRYHYESDEHLAKVAKTSVSEPLSKAHDISDFSDLFEDTQSVRVHDSDADILDDIEDPLYCT